MGLFGGGREELKGTDSCPTCGGQLIDDGGSANEWLYKCGDCGKSYKKTY